MKKVAFVSGIIAVLLGGLWLLQGSGLVKLRPILCFADCAPIQGPSSTWAIIGAVLIVAGGLAVLWSSRKLSYRR